MRRGHVEFDNFTGAHYNPSLSPRAGRITHDFNGKHYEEGSWQPRTGLARASGLVAIGQDCLAIAQVIGVDEGQHLVAIQADGKLVGLATPDPGWTT